MNVLSNIDLVLDYLENRSDVVDGDYGQPDPNEEMQLARELLEARDAVSELLVAAREATETRFHTGESSRSACDRLVAAIARFGD